MKIVQSFLTENPCYKKNESIQVKGLMLHSVGCSQPDAEVFVKGWNNSGAGRACVHAFIDGKTGKVYQTLPWEHRAWHAGGTANNTHIGVEMCEPGSIKYPENGGTAFTCRDYEDAKAVTKRTYDAAVELFASLCKKFGLDPLGEGVIISHREGGVMGVASKHVDPTHLWDGLNIGYTMDGFRQDVLQAMNWADDLTADNDEQEQSDQIPIQPDDGKSEQAEAGSGESKQPDQTEIQPGDIVRLKDDAVYYEGEKTTIANFVFDHEWIVKSVQGSRVVLGKNIIGSHEINSPVDVRYLIPVSRTEPEPAEKHEPMDISEKGIDFIKSFEGCRTEAYQCAAGVWTIGYGHTAGVKEGDKLSSKEAADALLIEDLKEYTGYVNYYMSHGIIGFLPLTQNQFDALTSFCFNRGPGRLRELVTGKNAQEVAEGMLSYVLVKGEINAGLKRRRESEMELFQTVDTSDSDR